MLQPSISLRRLTSFWRHSEGSLVPIFAVAFLPLLALVGTAVDYSRANNIRAKLQAALDAAVIAGAKNDTAAVDLSGNATVSTTDNCFHSLTYRAVDHSSLAPQPDAVCNTLPDPFANYQRPMIGGCDYTNYSLSGNKTVTLSPGVYCGGM